MRYSRVGLLRIDRPYFYPLPRESVHQSALLSDFAYTTKRGRDGEEPSSRGDELARWRVLDDPYFAQLVVSGAQVGLTHLAQLKATSPVSEPQQRRVLTQLRPRPPSSPRARNTRTFRFRRTHR